MTQIEAIEKAFADANDALTKARESHTGGWWNASVLRKRETLVAALSDAVRSGVRHVELADLLDGSGSYDTAEEEAENKERDEEAVSSVRPLIKVLVSAGMTISGLETYFISRKDIEEVLGMRGVQGGVEASIPAQAQRIFDALDHERINLVTDSALINDDTERRQIALNEIERQLGELGVISREQLDAVSEQRTPNALPHLPSGKAGALLFAASRCPENVREIAGQLLGQPISVTVVASHRVFPIECRADGVMFPDGRVVVDSPFTWTREHGYRLEPEYKAISLLHVVLPDGKEMGFLEGWQEIGYDDITATDFADLQRRVEALEMAIARGEELPTTDALLARFQHVMDRSRWMIDMDSGKVVEARWDAEDPPKNVAPYIVVSLPDGYNGHTLNFVGEPVERDGNQVKVKCAERGREYMIRWIADADLQSAIAEQVANAKAWEYRDEKEGVAVQSLDRFPPEKREQWTSERPLDAVPASLVGLDVGASDQAEERAVKPRMRP